MSRGYLEGRSRAEHQVMPEGRALEVTTLKMIAKAMERMSSSIKEM